MKYGDHQMINDRVFSALSDASRRKIVEHLGKRESTLLELSEFFPISFQALSKHIKVLEEADIVIKEKKGKYRVLYLNRNALEPSLRWISKYFELWNTSFDKLHELIQQEEHDKK